MSDLFQVLLMLAALAVAVALSLGSYVLALSRYRTDRRWHLYLTIFELLAVACAATAVVMRGGFLDILLAPLAAAMLLWSALQYGMVWAAMSAIAIFMVSLVLLMRLRSVLMRRLVTIPLGIALVAIPLLLQSGPTERLIRTEADAMGFDCYFVRPLPQALTYAGSEYAMFHGFARRDGAQFNWSYRAGTWQPIPAEDEQGSSPDGPSGRPEC